MPIHRGPRLDDLIARLAYVAAPIGSQQWYKTWPNLTVGTAVAAANAPAFGAWVEMISAAAAPTVPFTVTHVVQADNGPGNGLSGMAAIEIGTGALGAEVAVAYCSYHGWATTGGHRSFPTPLPIIPGGTRVVVRAMNVAGAQSAAIKIVTCLLPTRLDPFSTLRMATKFSSFYPGPTSLTAVGVQATAGTPAWTYGAYAQIWAGEANPDIITEVGAMGETNWQIAFATGPSGSEVVWGEFPGNSPSNIGIHFPLPIPLVVPPSTRHAAKIADAVASQVVSWPGLTFSKGTVLP